MTHQNGGEGVSNLHWARELRSELAPIGGSHRSSVVGARAEVLKSRTIVEGYAITQLQEPVKGQ